MTAVPTATIYPEPEVVSYVDDALRAGIRCVKVHVQVGGFDPADPLLVRRLRRLRSSRQRTRAARRLGIEPW